MAPLPSLFTVLVPVADTSAAQRGQAFQTALEQVLARVSGGQDLSGQPGYGQAVEQAGGLVQQFKYQADGATPPAFTLTISFDPGAVQRLITKLGATMAGIKPPLLLIVKADNGRLLGKDELYALSGAVEQQGYAVSYADPSQLPDLEKLADADPAALSAIGRLYHTGLVLLGDLKGNGADWTLIGGGQSQHWNGQGNDRARALADAGKNAADRLRRALNVIGAGEVRGKLWVSGLNSAMDYANLLAMLRGVPSIRGVYTEAAQEDGMLVSVKAGMPLANLVTYLTAGGRVMEGGSHQGADASLRWFP